MSELDQLLEADDWQDQRILDVDEPAQSLVIFRLGEQILALPGDQVREILPLAEIFFVPGCPADMPGVINLRGDILAIIELGRLLSLETDTDTWTNILVTKGSAMLCGFLVDEVLDLTEVPTSQLKPPLATLPAQLAPWVTAELAWAEKIALCLDAKALLHDYRNRLKG